MVRYLESNGYNVSYSTGIDTDRRGAELLEHKVFLSVGHDEYWSGPQRANVEAARDAGVNLAFFSGNEVFWKTRWENSIDGSGTPYRTLVSYKETHANAKIDPLPNTWTGTWRDPRFSPPADGGRPENALTGTMFTINCCAVNMVVGPGGRTHALLAQHPGRHPRDQRHHDHRQQRHRLRVGRGPSTTASGHPALFRLSQTTASGDKLQDYGSSYAPGFRHPRDDPLPARQRRAGLRRGHHPVALGARQQPRPRVGAADTAAQQATVNLFADMGVQPSTLRSGPRGRHRLHRHDRAHVDDHLPGGRRPP